MPLLTHRDEVRPESISLLFFSLYYFLFSSGLILKKKWLFAIILGIQIIWVNSHLFFILGPLLAGYFLFERVLTLLFGNSKNRVRLLFTDKKIRLWFALTFGLFAVSIVNPNGLAGALAPLQIFNNYAYRVAENQSTFFMIKYGANVLLYSYFIAISFIALLLTLCTLRNKEVPLGKRIAQLLLLTPFIFLANKINRMSPFFAVLVIPFIVQVCHKFINHLYEKHKQKFQDSIFIMGGSTVTCIVLILVLKLGFFVPHISMIGAGVLSDTYIPAHFFLENNLHGPVFNNYDIGGYLAYNLFPKEKLFLDNRPEAYAGEFLTDEYLAALKDEAVWKSLVQKYQLNVIFFLRHDQIDGAQQFLYNRVTDPEWVPVFVDDFVLILVKNSEQNKSVIDRYKLPQELFVMR
ncbi:MAG: hypothetical protein BroJett025_07990 [Patescibacteria group bacterium]|nr:MAG: hypothetical protein BroJett025_07990 [Patescibacteria group bacterium]